MRKLSSTLLASLVGASLLFAVAPAGAEMPPGMEVADQAVFLGSAGMDCTKHKMDGAVDSRVCWDAGMQRMWVKDDERDGYSGVASWSVPAFADSGYCRNKSKAGSWAYCQYDFPETVDNAEIVFGAGVYDGNGRDKWPARFQGWTRAPLN